MISMKWRPFEVLDKTVTFPVAECDNADTNAGEFKLSKEIEEQEQSGNKVKFKDQHRPFG